MKVGVLAVQGDFEKHAEAIQKCGDHEVVFIRTPDGLEGCDRLIIPGGESTTVGLLLQRFGLADAILKYAEAGGAIWGTCMGMILLAREVEDRQQFSLNLLDITVRRNAFGAQVHSFEQPVEVAGFEEPVMGVFIRAPIVVRTGPGVETLSTVQEMVVAVRSGPILGTSFHPELTEDTRFHAWFCSSAFSS